MKTIITIFLSIISIAFIHAQDSIRSVKSISFEQGFTYLVNKDLYRSPYIYKGFSPYASLKAEKTSAKSIQRFSTAITFGNIKTSFSPLASSYLLNLDYTYMRKIRSGKRYSFYAGLQLSGLSWNVNYFPEMEVPRYGRVRSYMLGISAGIGAQFNYSLSRKSSLSLLLSAPLCTYIDRPSFLDGSPRQDRLSFLGLWNPQAQLTYEYKASERVSIFVSYRYQYLQYAQPKEIRMLGNGLSVGIKLRFGK